MARLLLPLALLPTLALAQVPRPPSCEPGSTLIDGRCYRPVVEETDLLPLAPPSLHLRGGVLLGAWFGGELGVALQVPLSRPLGAPALSGFAFFSAELSAVYFRDDAGPGVRNTFAGLAAATFGWSQRFLLFSVVPRLGPAFLTGVQWGELLPTEAAFHVVGLGGVDLILHLGRFAITLGEDCLFNLTRSVWISHLGLGF